jgi:glycosyltransferase involved in cell wall biosynthesis
LLSGDPFVSVILAIRNEAGFIERTLTAILEQDFPSERMEVLIADGESTDSTRAVIASIAGRYPAPAMRECVDALLRTGADNVGGRMDPVGQNHGEADRAALIDTRCDRRAEVVLRVADFVASSGR